MIKDISKLIGLLLFVVFLYIIFPAAIALAVGIFLSWFLQLVGSLAFVIISFSTIVFLLGYIFLGSFEWLDNLGNSKYKFLRHIWNEYGGGILFTLVIVALRFLTTSVRAIMEVTQYKYPNYQLIIGIALLLLIWTILLLAVKRYK